LKEVSVLQQNLRLEKELQSSLNNQLEEEISFAQVENSRISEIERGLNE
jgi:hypothetical protein